LAAEAAGLRVEGLSKTFPGTRALDGVSLTATKGRAHGLVGGNGSGKSTLIKVLAGVVPGDPGGTVTIGGQTVASDAVTPEWARAARLSFVHQDLGLFDPLTVAENLFAGLPVPRRAGAIHWSRLTRDAQSALDELGIAVRAEAPLRSLRPAQRTLVAIARAVRDRQDLADGALVLDEPTARLPAAEVEFLLEALRRYAAAGQTILYVSHRLDEVLDVAGEVSVLRDGRVVAARGRDGLDERGLGRLVAGRDLAGAAPRPAAVGAGRPALETSGLAGGPLRGIDLVLRPNEVLGVAGIVGSGRTTLLELIVGARPRAAGAVLVGGRQLPPGDARGAIRSGIAYVPEDRAVDGAFMSLGIHANLSAADPGRHRRRLGFSHASEQAAARTAVHRFGIRASAVTAPLRSLSGGNQQKVVLARWLMRRPKVLLLDEPTQGVDVGARADIYRHIAAAVRSGTSVVLVSSDLDELLTLSDRVVVLADGAITAQADRAELDRRWLARHLYGVHDERAGVR